MNKREENEGSEGVSTNGFTGVELAETVYDLLGATGDTESHPRGWPNFLLSSISARSERTPGLLECEWKDLSYASNKHSARLLEVCCQGGESLPCNRDIAVLNLLSCLSTSQSHEVHREKYRQRFSYSLIIDELRSRGEEYTFESLRDSVARLGRLRISLMLIGQECARGGECKVARIRLWTDCCSRANFPGGSEELDLVWHRDIYEALIEPYGTGKAIRPTR